MFPWSKSEPNHSDVKYEEKPPVMALPLSTPFKKAMAPGEMVVVKGRALEFDLKADKEINPYIGINLQTDVGELCDNIPMHVSVRFRSHEIVYNSKVEGTWGKEEKGKLTFKMGEEFDIRVRAHQDKFVIWVNGHVNHEFEHRQALSHVDCIYVSGDLEMNHAVYGGKYYTMPYVQSFDGGLRTGKHVKICAVPEKKCEQFEIQLKTRGGDIALKLNPQFKKKEVIRNARKDGAYGNDEKESPFPFKAEQAFDMIIVNEPYSFQIYVDNYQLCTFAHRMSPDEIEGIELSGDLELHLLTVEGKLE